MTQSHRLREAERKQLLDLLPLLQQQQPGGGSGGGSPSARRRRQLEELQRLYWGEHVVLAALAAHALI